ncbi:hypothetical protein J0804_12075 [Bacillus mobilis]|nr:hypothetical protein [Bacillus mobilis]NEK96909.1 hypothetical protein [Bacillus mobilis]
MKRQLSKRWEKSEEKMVQNKVAPKMLYEVANRAINTRITLEAYESSASKGAIQEL